MRPTLSQLTPAEPALARLFTLRTRLTGRNLLCQPQTARNLLAAAYHCHAVGNWHCRIFLLLPDHVHAIAALPAANDPDTWLRQFKQYATRHTGVVWNRHSDHETLLDEREIAFATDYIRHNPVRLGLAATSEEWPWQWAPRALVGRQDLASKM
jgi:REP element-mobilizing transposase RayT